MHILQRLAKKSVKNDDLLPSGAHYDFASGAWYRDGRMIALDPGDQPTTKKGDIETGEDMKGQ